jgi:RimJ/RimL family protein N-acetyltransferase
MFHCFEEHANFILKRVDLQLSGKSDNLPLQVLRSSSPDETGKFIGTCSLRTMTPNEVMEVLNKVPKAKGEYGANSYELGYFIHPAWKGKGIVTVATKEIIAWGKAEYGAATIVRIAEDNVESMKLVERIPQFVRVEENDDFADWPATKGGGRKKILFWKWQE